MLFRHSIAIVAALAFSATSALPTSHVVRDIGESTSTVQVQCGCWNLCTLQQLADPTTSYNCTSGCDPIFSCESLNAPDAVSQAYEVPAPPLDGQEAEKRAIPTAKFPTATFLPTLTRLRTTIPALTPIVTSLPEPGTIDPPRPDWSGGIGKREPGADLLRPVDPDCDCVWGEGCPCGSANAGSGVVMRTPTEERAVEKREPDPSLPLYRPHCVCVVAEGCPCSGYEDILPDIEKRSALEESEADLAKRLAPTGSVSVSCSTAPDCSVTVTIGWSF